MTTATIHNTMRLSACWLNRTCLHFSHLERLRDCPRGAHARDMYDQLHMPTSGSKGPPVSTQNSGAERWMESVARSVFPMARRSSLTYVTSTGAVLGLNRPGLQPLLGAWNFALRFKREALFGLDVAFFAVQRLPMKRRCTITGTFLEDLLLVCGISPSLEADLRAPPLHQLFATDASPDGAGACVTDVSPDCWRRLYDFNVGAR